MRTHTRHAPSCPSGRTPFYRKIGGLHFVRLGRLQFSFCLCRPIPQQVTAARANHTIDVGMARIVQHQFGPF